MDVSIGTVIYDAAQDIGDEGFRKAGGRPFYVSAAQRGVAKMLKDTMTDFRTWTHPTAPIVKLPPSIEDINEVYVENCGVTRKVYIKENMHRIDGGYAARDKWDNGCDPLTPSMWNCAPPLNLLFAGRRNGELHLSDSCLSWHTLRVDYSGIGIDCMGDDFKIPYWMREAITDYVKYRAALKMRRQDKQYMNTIVNEMKYELERGSWLDAKIYAKRMDRKQRADL